MNTTAESTNDAVLEIRFGQIGLSQVRIRTTDPAAIQDELTARIAAAPRLFERMPVCVDLSLLPKEGEPEEIRAVVDTVRRTGLLPVGLSHAAANIDELARVLDMAVLTQFRPQSRGKPAAEAPPAASQPAVPAPWTPADAAAARKSGRVTIAQQQSPPPPPAPPQPVEVADPVAPSLMHHQPVRSGQRIYARHRDLVITTTVGAGAEVIADGCVHIYGVLRGRAVAGARGETTARVFCQEFHAELVSIAGVFRVFETIPAELAGKPVQAWLDGDALRFARIGG